MHLTFGFQWEQIYKKQCVRGCITAALYVSAVVFQLFCAIKCIYCRWISSSLGLSELWMLKMLGLVTPTRLKSPDLIAEARTEVDTLNYSTVSLWMCSCKRAHLYILLMPFAKTQGCMQEFRSISFLIW